MLEKCKDIFPDGTPIDDWFFDMDIPDLASLGKRYDVNKYGILDDRNIYTDQLQTIINCAHENGGGVIVVPKGTYYTGALFFKQGVHLYIEEGGVLKGSDDISDYPVCKTRIEGECCTYYPALINADGVDGFVLSGKGTIDGNGMRAWKAFWQRRAWNPNCTNKDEQRPRLLFLSNCKNVLIANLHLQNSPFWTNHIYKCDHVKFIGCHIFSPKTPIPAPSTDAIDIDACTDVLVKNCYMEVNDDAIALKGGKGPWADENPENGANERILIEDCHYGFCHSALTCGSESVHNKNILVRRIMVENILQGLHLKLRPDTPQKYEYITMEGIKGNVLGSFVNISPWTQFFDLKGRTDKPISTACQIVIKDCECSCGQFFNICASENYDLSDFTLKNLKLKAVDTQNGYDAVRNIIVENVVVERGYK